MFSKSWRKLLTFLDTTELLLVPVDVQGSKSSTYLYNYISAVEDVFSRMLPYMTWLYQDAISFRSPVTMPVYWWLVASG